MAPEALLPSEIARLVYGYLIEEKCTEIAKLFLNESPNLYECRMILQCGKTFTIHPFGLTLLNILDTFCIVNCIVQDHLAVYDTTNKLKNKDIVTQLKFLLGECCKSQQVANSSAQIELAAASGTPSKIHKKRHSGKNGLNVALQSDDGYQTETPPDSNSLQNIPSVEATPLKHLPGYVEGLQSKISETSWPTAIKSPSKATNRFIQNQQVKENVRSQVVQTSEIQKVCQATQIEKTIKSQEVQTSISQEIPIQEHNKSDKDVNTDSAVTCVGDELSNGYKPKTDLCNNSGNGHRAEEVINLDDSGEHIFLESQKSANSTMTIDENLSSPEDVDMDIDNENPSLQENEDVVTEDKKQYHPEATSVSPTTQNSQPVNVPEMTNQVIAPENPLIPDPHIPPSIVPSNVPNDKCLVNSIEPSLFDKDFQNPSEFPDHITSTPLKLFAAVQNYDNNEWFSAQTLPSSGIVPQETAGLNCNFPYVQNATESIVSPVEGFISPIICKENTKVAEKISLNCLVPNARKDDDTLNTPEVPPITKSFIPIQPATVPATFVPPKDKTHELPTDPNARNASSAEQTVQDALPNFSSISSLVKNTEFNRYFSIDSISVTQIDKIDNNTTNAAETSSAVPKVENSVQAAGTGLTPLLQMQKKTEDGNVEAQGNESSVVANNRILENEKVVEMNAEPGNVVMEDLSGEKLKETNDETNGVEEMVLTPPISRSTNEMVAQTVVNEVDKFLDIVATEEFVDEVDMNVDVVGETVDINLEENVNSTSKAVTSDVINGEQEKNEKETLEDVQVETIETNERTKERKEDTTAKVSDKMDVSIESTKHEEPKAPMTSGKKESLKSILSKKFESYIDATKESTASNHNNETARNTPKVTVEERAKRRSLSTPKKPSSHIRALTFETPIQSRSDSKIKDLVRPTSPETAKRNLKRVHESFQSPPVGDYEIDNQVQINKVSANTVNEKENVDDQNVGDTDGTLSQNKDTKDENVKKKSWDSDLRILIGLPADPPKVEIPKRKYRTKSKEGSSTKKKKRDKSETPRKEKTPHKKSKKSEKEKTPKKSHKHDKSKENRDDKKKDGNNAKTKAGGKLSAKDFKDLGAQIESNLLSNEDDNVVDKIEIKKKTDGKFSAEKCKDISALIESNLLSNKNDQVVNESENKKKVDNDLFAKEPEDSRAHVENYTVPSKNNKAIQKKEVKSKVEEKLSPQDASAKIVNNLIRHKHIKPNLNVARNKQVSTEKKSTKDETKEVLTKDADKSNEITNVTNATDISVIGSCEKVVIEVEDNVPSKEPTQQPLTAKTKSKKDPLEYLLSDSITDDDVLNDIMQMDSDDLTYHEELSRGNTQIDREIAEKMQQDEEAIAAVLEEANQAVNEKYKAADEEKTGDFFPDTSLMTDGGESQEEGELVEDVVVEKKELKENSDKILDNASKSAVDYNSIEQQLSIITNAEPTRKVIYDHVSKVEGGKIVKKKYARLKTLDTKLATEKSTPLRCGYEVELDSDSDSMEMPPTPQITDPGSNSWVPNPSLVRDDSQKTLYCLVPTPLECPPTPKIFITPRKEETVDTVPEKLAVVPHYQLTAITFETNRKPEVTEFEVVKEALKKTALKTPAEKEGEGKVKKTTRSARSKSRDKSVSRTRMDDSEYSDSSSSSSSSSSSDSSDSSSSSSDDEDSSSRQPSGVVKAIEIPPVLQQKVEVHVQNEEVVIGNEVIFVEHEEVVVAYEASPTKVFLIEKTDTELAETVNETPAKDENMIPEEGIFETPYVSKPVDNPTNLHAKISQMMILREQEEMRKLESQQKPKIDNVENVAPKTIMKDSKAKIVEKSEAEVAKAIESIACEKFDKSLEELNSSIENNKAPEVLKDKVKKRELSKAIQSITEKDDEEDSSDSSSESDSSSDDDPNLQLVLEDDVKDAEDFTDESLGLDNSEAQHAEFHVVFDEANYKKRRRKQFTDDEMMCEPHLEDGRLLAKITPSCVDILLNIHPAKKKMGPKKKGEVKEEEEVLDDGDSSEDFVPAKSTRGGTKRKRSNDDPKSRKRKKNMFIY